MRVFFLKYNQQEGFYLIINLNDQKSINYDMIYYFIFQIGSLLGILYYILIF